MDYFVSSDRFETLETSEDREGRRFMGTASDILATAFGDSFPRGRGDGDRDGDDGQPGKDAHHATVGWPPASVVGNSGVLQPAKHPDYSEQVVLFDSLSAMIPEPLFSANSAAARTATFRELTSLRGGEHGYHCIQHSKKMHPIFDEVLRGVLLQDPAARILLAKGSKVPPRFVFRVRT